MNSLNPLYDFLKLLIIVAISCKLSWSQSGWSYSWRSHFIHSHIMRGLHIYLYIYIYALLYELCFLWFTNCVLLSDYSLIPGCLWLLVFVLNNTLILGTWCSTIPHLPGCFCPWTLFQIIGFNMVPSDPFMSHLATKLIVTCLLHVGPPFGNRLLNIIWAVSLTSWIVYLHFLYFGTCNYICLDTSYHFLALSLLLKYSLFFQVLLY